MIKHYQLLLFNKLTNRMKPVVDYPVIYNVNGVDESIHTKRALPIYIVKPFLVNEDDPKFFSNQRSWQCKQIVSLLGKLGYIVDVVCGHARDKSNNMYDISYAYRWICQNK